VGQRGERFALYLWVLYGSRLLLMAGLERVSCSMPAVVCVYRRQLVASSTHAEAKTAEARARAVWGSFYLGLYIIVRTAATYAWTTPSGL
jgi:hypothetical protein